MHHAFGLEAGSSRAVAGIAGSFGKILRLLTVQSPAALAIAACAAWRALAGAEPCDLGKKPLVLPTLLLSFVWGGSCKQFANTELSGRFQ